ncbi:MAG: 2-amino-4-hydroxy-6-hydroxymethyldihydropteridine diphosphokinase [Bacillota bacterium]
MRSSMDNLILIGLGSNLGDCRHNLSAAINRIATVFAVKVVQSSLYRSEPVEVTDQPWFYNQVVGLELDDPSWGPNKILQIIKTIESEMGRRPGVRYGPRLIDLDLLFFKNWVYESEYLCLPHPKLEQRSFVLQPLLEIVPELIHPRTGRSIREIWESNRGRLSFCEKLES